MTRINILCAGKVLGAAIISDAGVSHVAKPGQFDRLATQDEADAHCVAFNSMAYGKPIYAKPAKDCRYNDPA